MSGRRSVPFVYLVGMALIGLQTTANAETTLQVTGDDAIELVDFRGSSLAWNPAGARPRVVVFFSIGCPLADRYADRIQALASEFESKGVDFLAVDSQTHDSLEEMAAFSRGHQLDIRFVRDIGQGLARALEVRRTPEVFLFDREGQIRYRGRIDDQYGVGYSKLRPDRRELRDAITALLGDPANIPAATDPVGCLLTYARPPRVDAPVSYFGQVAAILDRHCVRCHRAGQIGPFALDNFEDAAGWSEMIGEVIRNGQMPPWHAHPQFGSWANDCSLSDTDRQTVLDWVAAGAPQGNPADRPLPPQFVSGWQLPREPDQVIPVTAEPVSVPATGDVRYQYFVVDPQWKTDQWIAAAELRPSNLRVVHHILCFVRPRGSEGLGGDGEGLDGFLVGYVPGMLPQPLPAGMAKRIPKDSELVFQIHYTPIGSPQADQSQLGLVFADPETIEHEVITTCAVNPRIRIPAEQRDHPEHAWNRQPLQAWPILSLMPHMHLRGQAFRYEAVYPDGTRKTLLDVPKFDFNWQTSYLAKEPISLPAGTRIYCTALYDNSEGNLNNPDPHREVRWGDQTWEEMMIGYFDVAIPLQEVESRALFAQRRSPQRSAAEVAAELLQRWDRNGDQSLQIEEIPERWRAAIRQSLGSADSISRDDLQAILERRRQK